MARVVQDVSDRLPDDLDGLVDDGLRHGDRIVQRLQAEWHAGTNRFSGPGERLVAVRDGGRLVGIGGLNTDPYTGNPRVARVRRVYVHSDARRRGVASLILAELERGAVGRFDLLTVRTNGAGADAFYLAHGFRLVRDHPHISHDKTLPSA